MLGYENREPHMKKKINIFVSYARANKVLAGRFLERFRTCLRAGRRYSYVFWQDTDILVGESWHEEIQEALAACDIGLLLVSAAFLGSQYISQHEIPRFVGKRAKPVIPVLLQPVDWERFDLKGLKERQIFRLDRPRFAHPKAYGECYNSVQRDQFALELFRQAELKLDRLYRR